MNDRNAPRGESILADILAWLDHPSQQLALSDVLEDFGDTIASSHEATLGALRSKDLAQQLAALKLMREYWEADVRFVHACLAVVNESEVAVVRGAAAFTLIKISRASAQGHPTLNAEIHKVIGPAIEAIGEGTFEESSEQDGRIFAECAALDAEVEMVLDAEEKSWRDKLGTTYTRMLESMDQAIMALQHPDATTRRAALRALHIHWKSPLVAAPALRRMAFSDEVQENRDVALCLLAGCFESTCDDDIGRLLAGIVRDETQPQSFPLAAYRGLFRIRGAALDPENMLLEGEKFNIDWRFVDEFLGE